MQIFITTVETRRGEKPTEEDIAELFTEEDDLWDGKTIYVKEIT